MAGAASPFLSEHRTLATAADTAAPATPFHRLGGHATFRAICERFYDLMDSEPAYAQLRAMHAPDLGRMKESLALFLAGWAGGPRDWFDRNPGRCMMSVHKPYIISPKVAQQWADCMKQAIAETGVEDAELAKAMGGVLSDMALGMGRE